MRKGNGTGDVKAAFILLLERNVWRLLVNADAESFELRLDNLLVCEWLIDIKNNEDEVAGLGDGNDLTTATPAVLGAFNDAGKVNDLYRCTCPCQSLCPSTISYLAWHIKNPTIVRQLSRHRSQCSEFVRRRLRVLAREPAHERTLPHRGKANEPDAGHARARHIKTSAAAADARARREELALELGQLGLELAQVVRRRLVLLRPGHLLYAIRVHNMGGRSGKIRPGELPRAAKKIRSGG